MSNFDFENLTILNDKFETVFNIIIMKGVVKEYDNKKGEGYIITEEGDVLPVCFLDIALILKQKLRKGAKVMFDIYDIDRNPRAVNVFIIEED